MLQSPATILIIRYSSMGDVILLAPLVAYLAATYPGARLVLLTQRSYSILFRDDQRLSSVIGVKRGELSSSPELCAPVWDMVIDLQNNRQSSQQRSLLRYRELRCLDKLHFERNMLLLLRINLYRHPEPIALRYIHTIGNTHGTTATLPLDYRLPFHGDFSKTVAGMIHRDEIARPVIAFFPFSAWKNKEWNEHSFISVGQYFIIKGWNVVILGGATEKDRAARMSRHIGYRCTSLAGKLSLYECGIVLSRCKMALGCDTGLTHLARACGVTTGFIFGPTTFHFGFLPQNAPECRVFEHTHFCRPCHPHGGNFCCRLNRACMRSITPDEVIRGLMELYHG